MLLLVFNSILTVMAAQSNACRSGRRGRRGRRRRREEMSPSVQPKADERVLVDQKRVQDLMMNPEKVLCKMSDGVKV